MSLPGHLRVPDVLETPESLPHPSVVIVTYNSADTIEACLRSVVDADPCQVLVVDNASRDRTCQLVSRLARKYASITLVQNDDNLGFSEGCNVGLRLAAGNAVVLLNPDTRVAPGWLAELSRALTHEGDRPVGAVGPLSNFVAGQQQVSLWLDPTFVGKLVEDVHPRCAAVRRDQPADSPADRVLRDDHA